MLIAKILRTSIFASGRRYLEYRFKSWIKPHTSHPISGAFADLTRNKSELIVENAFLRQQLIVLQRQSDRPQLSPPDRRILVLLATRLRTWKDALFIVQPDTLLKWHRQGFRLFWRRTTQAQARRQPRIPEQTITLIKEMALANRLWGAKRIQGELLKLDIRVNKGTIKKYMRQARRKLPPQRPAQTWATFIANHAHEFWACDFLQPYDLLFRMIFVFFIIELGSRRVLHVGVTHSPSDLWVAQQLREATPFGQHPRCLIRDNDGKFGKHFDQMAIATGIEVLRTPAQAPKANAFCERFLSSVRRECLDHILILSERHLRRTINAYVHYFNHARPHQGIGQRIPVPISEDNHERQPVGRVTAIPVLNGLHHDYRRAA